MDKMNVHSIVATAAEIGGPKKQATEMTVKSLQDCCKSVIEKNSLKRVGKASIPSSAGPKKETYAGAAEFLMPAEKAAIAHGRLECGVPFGQRYEDVPHSAK
ncbi:uncharacterized protein LOC108153749 [Drosophila miranda]|uniref:uncharacterized protein LOC108153749 n=1 Tax=Drosophila miranda TaxID=7229 RepID=UPI0007E7465E|nr:uncharacterized protein LOC108153749 [Drosophila miranda]